MSKPLRTYQPSRIKRIRTHGCRDVIKRRRAHGRKRLASTVYEK